MLLHEFEYDNSSTIDQLPLYNNPSLKHLTLSSEDTQKVKRVKSAAVSKKQLQVHK